MAQFERRIDGPVPSSEGLLPPANSNTEPDAAAEPGGFFITEQHGASATTLPPDWEPGAAEPLYGPAAPIEAAQVAAARRRRAARPPPSADRPGTRPGTRASSRGDVRGPSKGDRVEAVPVHVANHDAQRPADVYVTSGARVGSFTLAPGSSQTRHTRGAAPSLPDAALPGAGVQMELSPLSMRATEERCSLDDEDAVTLMFSNYDTVGEVEVSWLDYDGRPVFRRALKPGESYMERSFASHPWLVRDAAKENSMLVTLGCQAARAKARFSAVWSAGRHQLSFMSQGTAEAGNVKRSIISSQPRLSSGRLAQSRAIVVQELRDQRKDPETNTTADFSLVVLPAAAPTSLMDEAQSSSSRRRRSSSGGGGSGSLGGSRRPGSGAVAGRRQIQAGMLTLT
eukprot:g7607.t1